MILTFRQRRRFILPNFLVTKKWKTQKIFKISILATKNCKSLWTRVFFQSDGILSFSVASYLLLTGVFAIILVSYLLWTIHMPLLMFYCHNSDIHRIYRSLVSVSMSLCRYVDCRRWLSPIRYLSLPLISISRKYIVEYQSKHKYEYLSRVMSLFVFRHIYKGLAPPPNFRDFLQFWTTGRFRLPAHAYYYLLILVC